MDFRNELGLIDINPVTLNNHISNEAFSIGENFPIYWYGIIFMSGFAIAILAYCLKLHFHYKVSYEPGFYYLFLAVPMTIIGARIWSIAIGDATNFFDFRQGGLAIQGGVIAGVLSAIIFFPLILRKPKFHVRSTDQDGNTITKQPSMWIYADAIIPTILIGQALGRWGNFINGEIYGAETTEEQLQWLKNVMPAVFDGMKNYLGEGKGLSTIYHPLFLYESFFNVIVFLIIYFGITFIKQIKIGVAASSYFMFYGIIRFVTENARAPQFTFTGTYVINSLLLIGGVLGMILIQFVVPKFRGKYIMDGIFAWMLPPSWKKKVMQERPIGDQMFYANR